MISTEEKRRVTTFSVVSSHIISSTMLFPVLWLIIGSVIYLILEQKQVLPISLITIFYYIVMLASFYAGIKYSLSFIDKRYIVSNPELSLKFSILFFLIGVLLINYIFIYFEEALNWFRLIFSILLLYMFVTLTNKYFKSLEADIEYIEYPFLWQVLFLFTNFSLLIAALTSYTILVSVYSWMHSLLIFVLIIWFGPYSKVIDKLFIPFFYKSNEEIAVKRSIIVLLIALPVDFLLISTIISQY